MRFGDGGRSKAVARFRCKELSMATPMWPPPSAVPWEYPGQNLMPDMTRHFPYGRRLGPLRGRLDPSRHGFNDQVASRLARTLRSTTSACLQIVTEPNWRLSPDTPRGRARRSHADGRVALPVQRRRGPGPRDPRRPGRGEAGHDLGRRRSRLTPGIAVDMGSGWLRRLRHSHQRHLDPDPDPSPDPGGAGGHPEGTPGRAGPTRCRDRFRRPKGRRLVACPLELARTRPLNEWVPRASRPLAGPGRSPGLTAAGTLRPRQRGRRDRRRGRGRCPTAPPACRRGGACRPPGRRRDRPR